LNVAVRERCLRSSLRQLLTINTSLERSYFLTGYRTLVLSLMKKVSTTRRDITALFTRLLKATGASTSMGSVEFRCPWVGLPTNEIKEHFGFRNADFGLVKRRAL